jgi:ubiquitin-conjugating enzyme E2 D/E
MASYTALRRIQRDMLELERDPVPNVVAAPRDGDDLFEWTVTMVGAEGPHAGWPIHLHVTLPDDYPRSPPSVRMRSTIEHPNLFGSYICLDMLKVRGACMATRSAQRAGL